MKKIIVLMASIFLLSACSNKEIETHNKPVFAVNDFGESIKVPILADDLIIGDVHYYPLAGIENYYGVQVRITNKTNYTIEKFDLSFRGTYKNEEYSMSFTAKEDTICQLGCKKPKLSFYGEMYFNDSIEYLPEFMNLVSFNYRVKTDKFHAFSYNFKNEEYIAHIRYGG